MVCDLCDSGGTNHKELTEPTEAKYCGHEDQCDCSHPSEPDPLGCDSPDSGEPGSACVPDGKIRELESTVATSKAEAEEAQATLTELTKHATDLQSAIGAYKVDKANREKRVEECKEFIECKKPDVSTSTEECVDGLIDKVCAHIDALEDRARYLNWKQGQAHQHVRWVKWEYDRIAARYNVLKDLATKCDAHCAAARSRYDQAQQSGDKTQMYLYWQVAQKLDANAVGCCRDPKEYERKLCDAFDALFEASMILREAKHEEQQLAADLERVQKEQEKYKDQSQLWVEIERLVDMCCVPTTGQASQTPTQQSGSPTQQSGSPEQSS